MHIFNNVHYVTYLSLHCALSVYDNNSIVIGIDVYFDKHVERKTPLSFHVRCVVLFKN